MQEEVTRGAVTLIVDGAKLSEQVFEKAVKKFLEEIQKSQKPKIYRAGRALNSLPARTPVLPISRSVTRISRLSPVWRRNTMWILLEERHLRRAAPLPGLFQKPGRGCHHSGVSGVCQPENEREEKPPSGSG